MQIFLSAGEPSGDHHAANLVRAIKERQEGVEFVGFGGPRLEQAGCRLLYRLTDLTAMWFFHVALNLHKFLARVSEADRFFRHHRPDAVVLIDCPGFNWWIARRAKFHGIPVFYYVPPQIWAWATWRVKKMRRFVDHVLCSLPFEPKWYQERQVHAVYIGHPFFDESGHGDANARLPKPSDHSPTRPLVGLLPGSRKQEVKKNFAIMLRAATRLAHQQPSARFEVACFSAEHRTLAYAIHAELARNNARLRDLEITYCVAQTPRIIHEAEACLAVSGSVSIELMKAETPSVILYKISRFYMVLSKLLLRAKYITLVNLLADDEVFPEFLTDKDCSRELAEQLGTWLSSPDEAEQVRAKLRDLKANACFSGASCLAAEYILDALTKHGSKPRRPHFSMGSSTPSRLR